MLLPGPGPAFAASELRRAAKLVERHAPAGFQPDVTDILRRLGLMVVALVEHDATTTCRRCGQAFTYEAAKFVRKRLTPPRHCYPCRERRRNDQRRSTT